MSAVKITHTRALHYQLEAGKASVRAIDVVLPPVDTAVTLGRGAEKISSEQATRIIVTGLERDRSEIYVGKAACPIPAGTSATCSVNVCREYCAVRQHRLRHSNTKRRCARTGYRNGSRRTRIPRGLIATTAPVLSASSKAGKLTISRRARSSTHSVETSRVRITDGDVARCAASNVPKSVSEETTTHSPDRAKPIIAASSAAPSENWST